MKDQQQDPTIKKMEVVSEQILEKVNDLPPDPNMNGEKFPIPSLFPGIYRFSIRDGRVGDDRVLDKRGYGRAEMRVELSRKQDRWRTEAHQRLLGFPSHQNSLASVIEY